VAAVVPGVKASIIQKLGRLGIGLLRVLPFGRLRSLPPPLGHLHQARSIGGAHRHVLGDLRALGRQCAAFGSVVKRSHEGETPQ